MSRDGSSGGVIRMAVITKDGVERLFVPGNKLPGKVFVKCLTFFFFLLNKLFIVHWEG